MRIQHNIMAMNAYRNYSNNTSALSKNLEKLSSGYKINRAGDDAAGLAISEKMRAQITGLATAQKNAKDGISLIQTAEGALTEVHDMLNRMVELADQSANGTYDDNVDRANLQEEFNALRSEIDRISKATNFNGINLLDGKQAQTGVDKALGDIMAGLSVDGTQSSAATKAEISVTLGEASSPQTLPAMATADGVTASSAVTGQIKLTFGTNGNFAISGGDSINISNTSGQDILDMKLADGRKLGDLFDCSLGTTAAVSGTDVTLTAKSGGKIDQDVIVAIRGAATTGVAEVTDVVEGKNVGEGGAATSAKYQLKFAVSGADAGAIIAGGQKFRIGDKEFVLRTDSATSDASGAICINFTTGDVDTASGQDKIKTAIETAIKNAVSGDFTVSASVSGGNTIIDLTATAEGAAGNDKVFITAGSSSAVSLSSYTAGKAGNSGAAGTPAKTEYAFDLNNLKVGSTLVIGGVTMNIVDDSDPTAIDNDKITLTDAKTTDKLAQEFYAAGFSGANLTIADGKITITSITDGATHGSFGIKDDVVFTQSPSKVTGGANGMDITIGTTSGEDLLAMKVDGDKTIGDLFDVKVNGTAITNSTVITGGNKITFTAKTAGALSDSAMDAIMGYKRGGAEVSGTNGTDAGAGAAAEKAKYTMKIDAGKLDAGTKFYVGDKAFQITNGGNAKEGHTAININGMSSGDALNAIKNAIEGALGGDFDVTYTAASGVADITLTAKNAGISGNLGQFKTADDTNSAISGTYKAAAPAPEGGSGSPFAQVSWSFDPSKLHAGDKLTIGDTSLTVVADDATPASGQIKLSDAQNGETLAQTFEANGYDTGKITVADGKLTITGKVQGQKADDLLKGAGKVTIDSETRSLSDKVGGLTLQIGDTSDEYNQLTVNIDSMDCKSLGIDSSKINISDQGGAQSAVSVLKDAINKVSTTRGGLGALQNRLEHTINNLSVMQENIQDAESSIRDVDVAEEMMAYTKNNILVQSAQAMLAQANQLPQGVLQLLQ